MFKTGRTYSSFFQLIQTYLRTGVEQQSYEIKQSKCFIMLTFCMIRAGYVGVSVANLTDEFKEGQSVITKKF